MKKGKFNARVSFLLFFCKFAKAYATKNLFAYKGTTVFLVFQAAWHDITRACSFSLCLYDTNIFLSLALKNISMLHHTIKPIQVELMIITAIYCRASMHIYGWCMITLLIAHIIYYLLTELVTGGKSQYPCVVLSLTLHFNTDISIHINIYFL